MDSSLWWPSHRCHAVFSGIRLDQMALLEQFVPKACGRHGPTGWGRAGAGQLARPRLRRSGLRPGASVGGTWPQAPHFASAGARGGAGRGDPGRLDVRQTEPAKGYDLTRPPQPSTQTTDDHLRKLDTLQPDRTRALSTERTLASLIQPPPSVRVALGRSWPWS